MHQTRSLDQMVTAVARAAVRSRWLPVASALVPALLVPSNAMVALGLVAVALASVWLVVARPGGPEILAILLFGAVVLNYGWANIGFSVGGLPLPITEMFLAVLFPYAVARRQSISKIGAPAYFLLALYLYASIRLIIDYQSWGVDAVRDFTTPLELTTFFTAYCAMHDRTIKWARRVWMATFSGVLLMGILLPWQGLITEVSPIVGLRQPVPLLTFSGLGAALGAAFLFFVTVVRPSIASVILVVLTTAAIAALQARGLYLAVPLALAVILMLNIGTHGALGPRAMQYAAASFLLMLAVISASALNLRIEGRLGTISPGFVAQQVGTLFGADGPGSGSLDHRVQWLESTLGRVSASPVTLLTGLGLGPDLSDGFASETGQLVRKPHNDFLEIFARFGILGLSLWVSFIITCIIPQIFFVIKHPHGERATLVKWMVSSSVLYLAMSATQPYLAFPYGTIPLVVLLGMGASLASSTGDLVASRGSVTEPGLLVKT